MQKKITTLKDATNFALGTLCVWSLSIVEYTPYFGTCAQMDPYT